MNKFQKRIVAAVSTSAMVLNMVVVPVSASSYSFEVTGNGADSRNEIEFRRDNSTEVFQNNQSVITNSITVQSNTGSNSASDNTGGDVEVRTGNVKVGTEIINQANVNQAFVEACDCDSDVEVKIGGNGADSRNEVELRTRNNNSVVQNNSTLLNNMVSITGNTGDNEADDNTGGEVEVRTGNVMIAPVKIHNMAGSNTAVIGGGSGQSGSELSLMITGNGADSRNEIEVRSEYDNGIFQNNQTVIANMLELAGFTGGNSVSFNTGDSTTDPFLMTGDVWIGAMVHNEAGFNYADADCGCVLDIAGSISGNGADSRNEVELRLDDESAVRQDNADIIVNAGGVVSDTGSNEVDDNTAGEVEVRTGNTETLLSIMTLGGFNGFGVEIQWPWAN